MDQLTSAGSRCDLEGRNVGGVGLLSTRGGGGYGRWWWPATMDGAARGKPVEQREGGEGGGEVCEEAGLGEVGA